MHTLCWGKTCGTLCVSNTKLKFRMVLQKLVPDVAWLEPIISVFGAPDSHQTVGCGSSSHHLTSLVLLSSVVGMMKLKHVSSPFNSRVSLMFTAFTVFLGDAFGPNMAFRETSSGCLAGDLLEQPGQRLCSGLCLAVGFACGAGA